MPKKTALLTLDYTLRGGIERYVSNISMIFVDRGHDNSIISLHKTNSKPLYPTPAQTTIVYGSDLKFGFFYKITTLLSLIKCLNKNHMFNEYSTIISTHPLITIILGLLCPKILSKTVASEHSTYASHGYIVCMLRKFFYKKLKFVYTQTNDGVRSFRDIGINCIKIPNPVTHFNSKLQWQSHSKAALGEPLRILSVGRFDPVKQFHHIVDLSSRLVNKNIVFSIYGEGDLRDEIETLVIDNNLTGMVKIHNPISDLSNVYSMHDFLLITSASEAFPMVMLEAMSFGLPVISYKNLVGPNEVIENEKNGYLVEQDNVEALSKLCDSLICNSNYEGLSNSALITAKKYDANNVYSLMHKLL